MGRALGGRRDEVVIATKGGVHWENRVQHRDASPQTLKRQCEQSLGRLGTDRIDLYYIHAPDPAVPVADSAGGLKELLRARGLAVSGLKSDVVKRLIADDKQSRRIGISGMSAGGIG